MDLVAADDMALLLFDDYSRAAMSGIEYCG
jgi:hypothetical protein